MNLFILNWLVFKFVLNSRAMKNKDNTTNKNTQKQHRNEANEANERKSRGKRFFESVCTGANSDARFEATLDTRTIRSFEI